MTDHPLRPAMHRRLGRPLPHQLANAPQAHLLAPEFSGRSPYAGLPRVSSIIPLQEVGYLRVTHPSATVSEETVRLACLKPAYSVHSEPGSNSPIEIL